MRKILVSACLSGQPVRYNGTAKSVRHPALDRWRAEGRLVFVCPELSAGFSVPRSPAEIAGGCSGEAVLDGAACIVTDGGEDVTDLFIAGARKALALALDCNCAFAILTDGSPSCGSSYIYDGSFSGRVHPGAGVTTALLRRNGIEVFHHTAIDALQRRLSAA
ncbi:DUF523 domain-containing protein [Acetobacter oeni]|nr:DUF523 domain-containing protein [Acetobacter oeni]MBB3883622.1 uncharacterized protein YbbK (DUF523 family) [Acetobacter oeni]NHO19643.1 DUF523 domain-containing protein [Acetobacter oeni]GBR02690.1 hypothetical protein AA21952_0832 [Acetobacter oeni LMG 21952]